ncbi:MAG TPA: AraC family transcriptional regulator [Polyangiales bacterium]|nr:AraC family transcriptional regulator [Polyangiales bacterium]
MTPSMDVSMIMVRAVAEAVHGTEGRDERLMRAAQLDPRRLDDPCAQLSLTEYERVFRAALELSGDEALGLHMVERASSAAFDVLGPLTAHAASLRQAIETLAQYARIIGPGPRAELIETGDSAWVRFAIGYEATPKVRFIAELALSGLMRMLRAFVAPDVQPRAVCFAYPAPSYRDAYARVFGGAERFEQAFTGIELERAWLDRPAPYKNPELYALLKSQADRVLGRVQRAASLSERVKTLLGSRDPRALPSMAEMARELDISERSLRRRLLAERTCYRDLVERIGMDAAKRMLEDPRVSIQQAAYATGFGTSASFHRAFKRWTGKTPAEYRASY